MPKKRFKLQKLLITNPRSIISNTERDNVSELILIFATVFNQIKGIMLLHRLFLKEYEKPNRAEISDHAGEYTGIDIQLQAISISVVQEFFTLISKNAHILESDNFKKFILKLPKKTLNDWEDLIEIALGKNTKNTEFANFLKIIRNNVGFHFNYDLEQIRDGFIKHFYNNNKNEGNTHAFFSLGNDVPNTRFYFGDAAISGLMEAKVPSNFVYDFFKNIDKIIQTISGILALYLREKGFSEYKK